jgi:hypothetical protein
MKIAAALLLTVFSCIVPAQSELPLAWRHLSSKNGDIPPPGGGKEQTSATVMDIDNDSIGDFVITERTERPSVICYRRVTNGWQRYVIDAEPRHIEAGATFNDIDGDGDLDFVAGGDYKSNEVWWWENPYPNLSPDIPWKRHLIKNSGAPKHHDLTFGEFFGDGKQQLVFWNQEDHKLWMATIPPLPGSAGLWPLTEIYSYSATSQPEQRGDAAWFKGVNEHEGLAVGDVDADGKQDIVGGGLWFKNLGEGHFESNTIDAGYAFSRAALGHLLKEGKQEQIVLVIGDGVGPLMWYQLAKGTWVSHKIADVRFGHTLQLLDFNRDGNLDIFCAEQRLDGANPDSKIYIFLGDGKGNFKPVVVATGYDSHESKAADLDGNGTFDLLIKPYNYDTPRLDIFLNMGSNR